MVEPGDRIQVWGPKSLIGSFVLVGDRVADTTALAALLPRGRMTIRVVPLPTRPDILGLCATRSYQTKDKGTYTWSHVDWLPVNGADLGFSAAQVEHGDRIDPARLLSELLRALRERREAEAVARRRPTYPGLYLSQLRTALNNVKPGFTGEMKTDEKIHAALVPEIVARRVEREMHPTTSRCVYRLVAP